MAVPWFGSGGYPPELNAGAGVGRLGWFRVPVLPGQRLAKGISERFLADLKSVNGTEYTELDVDPAGRPQQT